MVRKGGLEVSIFIKNSKSFLSLDEVKQRIGSQAENLIPYFDAQLFLCIQENGTNYVLADDLPFYVRLAEINTQITDQDRQRFGGVRNLFAQFFKLSDHTAVYLPDCSTVKPLPAFVRNLFYCSEFIDSTLPILSHPARFDLMGVIVVTYEPSVAHYMEQVIQRKLELDRVGHSNFVNTASYMGSKKKIAGFIIESMFPYISKDSIFVDLMCGSGAMSQAFSYLGPTYASDAQTFCQLLAKVQGRGFTRLRAQQVLEHIAPYYHEHIQILTELYRGHLEQEATLYHQDWSDREAIFSAYIKFVAQFQLYSSTSPVESELAVLISEYKTNSRQFPYCLFTLYFSNVFFGLLQCIQLDSLRYAIDKLEGEEKSWALGVLIVTANQIASSHAGHFAQPRNISSKNILKTLSQRQKSAYHEFSKRFLCLGEESEQCQNEIRLIPGPWENALGFVDRHIGKRAVIYLDAPYKRDEYSRYYHVLETLVKYDYPSSEFKGRIRSKKLGERFSTEFFTKTSSKVDTIFIKIISQVLTSDMTCVWSYSSNGVASIINVIEAVREQIPCRIHMFSIPHQHQSQRRNGHKLSVTEYCIVFSPHWATVENLKNQIQKEANA